MWIYIYIYIYIHTYICISVFVFYIKIFWETPKVIRLVRNRVKECSFENPVEEWRINGIETILR